MCLLIYHIIVQKSQIISNFYMEKFGFCDVEIDNLYCMSDTLIDRQYKDYLCVF
jgi:hypothetical protein